MTMFSRRRRAQPPLLNTAATADMSFMLLIFFLVTTSMDSDKGLERRLSPADPQHREQPTDVAAAHVLHIVLTADNSIVTDGEPPLDAAVIADGRLRRRVAAFVQSVGQDHVIRLTTSSQADYATYFAVMNEITAAYNTLGGRYEQHVAEDYP